MIDITYEIHNDFVTYPGDPGIHLECVSAIEQGDVCNIANLSMGTHTATHMDALNHFIPTAPGIEAIPIEHTIGRARVIHIPHKRLISAEDLEHYKIEERDMVLIKTDNSLYFDGSSLLSDYAALTYDAACYLVKKRVKLVGIDYLTVEPPDRSDYCIHHILLSHGIPIVETLKLKDVNPGIYELICLPLKIKNADGSPVRAVLRTLDHS